MFCPWSGLAGHICYLSSKPFDLILTLGSMATVHHEKQCFLREGSGLKRDEMFPAQKLISQCFTCQRKYSSLQNLPWSFRSFKAFPPKKGSLVLLIDLVPYKSINIHPWLTFKNTEHSEGRDFGECCPLQTMGYSKSTPHIIDKKP